MLMRAPASRASSQSRPRRAAHRAGRWQLAALSLSLLLRVAPAAAEVGFDLTTATEERFRGRSLSAGQAVAGIGIASDFANGVYLGSDLLAVWDRRSGPEPLAGTVSAGYALRTRHGPTIDFGVIGRHYTRFASTGYPAPDVESYIGLITPSLRGRFSVAPDNDGRGHPAYYLEAEGSVPLSRRLRGELHLGLLAPPPHAAYGFAREQYDWRVALSQRFGALRVTFDYSGSGPGRDYYRGSERASSALSSRLSLAF